MDVGSILFCTVISALLLLVLQRTDRGKRVIVLISLLVVIVLLRNFAVYRQLEGEAWTGVIAGAVISFLFWLFIGRYNPPRSTDDTIHVIGLDD